MTRLWPTGCKGKWCVLLLGYVIKKKILALHFLFVLRGEEMYVLVINQLWLCRWGQYPGGWCSNKTEGTWVPEGQQSITTIVLGLGFPGDKDSTAFISEVTPRNTTREWGIETEKGKKPMKCTYYHTGLWSSVTMGNTARTKNVTQSYPAQGARELGYLYANTCGNWLRDTGGREHSSPGTLSCLTPGRVLWGQREPSGRHRY